MLNINKTFFDYLYDELGAEYRINPGSVELNLNNDLEKNLEYLGTYFPRSFVESYYIYDNLFGNSNIFNIYDKKETIRILDIGSGTGGSLFGLVQVLMTRFNNKKIEIISIDGNRNALELQYKIFKDLKKLIDFKDNTLDLKTYIINLSSKNDIELYLDKIGLDDKIDIMQSFKVINEFYRSDYKKNKGMYAELLNLGKRWLKESGILCIADVTNKINNGQYASILFNEEVKKCMCSMGEEDLVYILPKDCAFNYRSCTKEENCFTKRTFNVNFGDNYDVSKINYKVFIKSPLGKQVKKGINYYDNKCK